MTEAQSQKLDEVKGQAREDEVPSLQGAPAAVLGSGSLDPVYEAKARVLNKAIQDIGMGRYQWQVITTKLLSLPSSMNAFQSAYAPESSRPPLKAYSNKIQLFIVIGFGWASDNLWPIVTSLIFTPVKNEFHPTRAPLLSLAQNIGLLFGAIFWGFGCDIFGRRWAFNLTLGITGVFGMIAAGSPNFAAIGTFAALWSVGVGGNLPVDSAIFLEFLPGSHQYLLTVLSIDWALAQVFATLVAWPLLGNLTCQETDDNCTKSENMGWRYFMLVMGGVALIMFLIRFVFFTVYESPKFLMGKGKDAEAVKVVHEVARRNGKTSTLTLEELEACNSFAPAGQVSAPAQSHTQAALKRNLEKLNTSHIKALFATKKLAFSTGLITLIWAFIGLGFPLYNAFLPFIQASRGADFGDGSTYLTYRNSLIIAVLGVPGCLLGGVLVALCWAKGHARRFHRLDGRFPLLLHHSIGFCFATWLVRPHSLPSLSQRTPTDILLGTAPIISCPTSCMQFSTPTHPKSFPRKTAEPATPSPPPLIAFLELWPPSSPCLLIWRRRPPFMLVGRFSSRAGYW
jgi:MFS family permease